MNAEQDAVIQVLQRTLEQVGDAERALDLAIGAILRDQWEHPEHVDWYGNRRQELEVLRYRIRLASFGLSVQLDRLEDHPPLSEIMRLGANTDEASAEWTALK